jgi:hypothetical protein
MEQIITSPEKFANYFNRKVPGAYRQLTTGDAKLLTECGLIRRHSYYIRSDLETVRAILQYEKQRERVVQNPPVGERTEPPVCKLCGEPLPTEPERKKGRPREYCDACESKRARDRSVRWRKRRRAALAR